MFCLISKRAPVLLSQSKVARSAYLIPRLGVISQASSPDLISVKDLWRPVLFAFGFTGISFGLSAIFTYERYRSKKNFIRRFWDRQKGSFNNGQVVAATITALNVAVFACFRIKRLHTVMNRYFVLSANKNGPICLPMILSTFCHKDLFHLGINMFVLFSFSAVSVSALGPEQFVAMYTSAGVFASLVSLLHKTITKCPAASVGASGAILAIFALHCLMYPDSRIQIVFLPFLACSAGSALPSVMALDSLGIALKWRFLDHAAHLGGSCAGLFYYFQGQKMYQQYGSAAATSWHRIRPQ